MREKQKELKPEEFYKVFGREITKSERDKMTMEMLLIAAMENIRAFFQRGGDQNIFDDSLINTLTYEQLNRLVSDADAFLRSNPRY